MTWIKKTPVQNFLKIALMVALISWLVHSGHFQAQDFKEVQSPALWVGLILLVGFNLALSHYRWFLLLASQKFETSPFRTLPVSLIGLFFNFFIPGSVGGDLIKAVYISRDHKGQGWRAGTTILVDRLAGLWAMLVLALGSFFFLPGSFVENKSLLALFTLLLLLMAGLTVFFVLCFLPQKWMRKIPLWAWVLKAKWIHELYGALHQYRHHLKTLCGAVLVSLLAQTVAMIFVFIVGFHVDPLIPMEAYFFAVPLGFMLSAVPIAPGGVGVGQLAFLGSFQLVLGRSTSVGLVGVTLMQICLFIWSLLGAYFYLIGRRGSVRHATS